MIKVNRLELSTWKTRLRVLIDYAHTSPNTVISIAQTTIDEMDEVEAKEEAEWLEALQKERQEGHEIWL